MPHFVWVTVLIFVLIGPRAYGWQGSSLGLELFLLHHYLFYRVFESFCVSYLFRVNFHFISNCYLCLNVVSSNVMLCRLVSCHVSRVNICLR